MNIFYSILALGLSVLPLIGQSYDFLSAQNQLANNLGIYNNSVVAIIDQKDRGEIFRFEVGMNSNDQYGIASCSKWLSGAIVLACVERGYFSLNDRIGDYLPIFDEYDKGDITIRQCFAMTAGFKSPIAQNYSINRNLTLAESVDLIAQNTPVAFPPGTQLGYDSAGMQVVGRICEMTTGKNWGEILETYISEPLGMTSTDYLYFGKNTAIAGGARSTAEDYMKFLRMILNNGLSVEGVPVLSSRSIQLFYTNQTMALPEFNSPWPESSLYTYQQRPDYGMGTWIFAQNPDSGVVEELASPGAFGAFPWVDRERQLCGIVFIHKRSGFTSTFENNILFFDLIQAEIDNHLVAEPPQINSLSLSLVDDFLQLDWRDGTLETSIDLEQWEPLPWAESPFVERYNLLPANRIFYRVVTD